ncbi:hypothetical protein DWQ65_10100 [Treponema phagedenis]|uniref:ABC transporter permease n=1 Tax=Treponema phagedenis TaxID=162 RepID=A0A0B7GTG9_TREPH|nr:ABC transporter permease [Treponema phagedenis]QEJ99731.1 hypothetical protein FUT84_00095 [Treponema phagedenis]QSH94843.1 hypothetical protein C5O78_07280 [Treponema phagedenis]QSI00399.1 hypothetical protein DWQ65_10100 [Treponema phagedenis]CEM61939.1 conserved membrane hypothetical protein [Treponema phagedenis]
MSNAVFALYKKELYHLAISPVPFAALLIMQLGLAFPFIGMSYWFLSGVSELQSFFLNAPFLFCFVIPLLTMNIWSDERKAFTDKLLFSYPVSEQTIAGAKYLALVTVYACILIISSAIPVSVFQLGDFSFSVFLLSYAALFLFGSGLLAISLGIAVFSSYTAVNFLLSFIVILFFSLIQAPLKVYTANTLLAKILLWFAFPVHFESAARGIFDLRDFAFYAILIFFGIQLTTYVLQRKHRI